MSECTGCGRCCLGGKCPAGEIAFGMKDEICPALVLVRPGFYRCMLMVIESENNLNPIIKDHLLVGHGCTNEFRLEEQKGRKINGINIR
jgi:hypothetical protein